MWSLAALAFCVSAVSVLGGGARGRARGVAALLGLVAAASAVRGLGMLEGLLFLGVLAMTAASVLVLVLAPRPGRARTVAWVSGLLGLVPFLAAVLVSGVSG